MLETQGLLETLVIHRLELRRTTQLGINLHITQLVTQWVTTQVVTAQSNHSIIQAVTLLTAKPTTHTAVITM